MKTVIVSGGNINYDFALDFLKTHPYEYLIAADRGLEFVCRAQIRPNEIVGDFDSAREELLPQFADEHIPIRRFCPEKDYTDMEIAMETALERGSSEITVLGATGTRVDHVLGSIRNLSMAMKQDVPCCLLDPWNRIWMTRKPVTLKRKTQYGKYVSLLAHGGPVRDLTLEGFFYPLHNHTLGPDSALGISNEIVAEKAKITFSEGVLLVVESRDPG